MATPLLRTKLYIPPLRVGIVPRPRLVERLNAGLSGQMGVTRKLRLISAPAGFGKTTLLSEWLAGPSPRVAWLSLDARDNELTRFLAYLIAALQTVEGDLGQEALDALQSPGAVSSEEVLTALLNELAGLKKDLILVLDDYHVIESAAIDQAVGFLLDHLPPQVHLVIASRIEPTLPLSRLRARGQLTEVRADDLRFTAGEAAAFLDRAISLPVSPEDVSRLAIRTEGWITGLQLAAAAMQGLEQSDQIAAFIHTFGGSHRYIIDYLVDEVLDRQTPEIQEFLSQTCILDRMTAPLCDAVAGRKDSRAILEKLEAANLFLIPLDGERRWYRYHHLFADLLRQRLLQKHPGDEAGLHIRASEWYEANGLELEALHHAAAANDFERAARLVEGDGNPLYHRGEVIPVLNWLESLPPGLLDDNPSLWVMYAEILMTRGRLAGAEEAYLAGEAALQSAGQDAGSRDLLGRIANGRGSLAALQRRPEETIALSRRALELLHPDNLPIRAAASLSLGSAYQLQGDRAAASQAYGEAATNGEAAGHLIVVILATQSLGDMQAAENRLHQAAQTYRHALELAGDRPMPYSGEGHLGLARIFYEWNDLDAAQRHGQQGLQLTQKIEQTGKTIAFEILFARLKLARRDVAGAVGLLDQASQAAEQQHFASWLPEATAAQVRALLYQGDLSSALDLAVAHDLPLSLARVHLAQGNAAAALAELEPWRRQMETKGWQDEVLEVMVLQAIALRAHGETDAAVELLGDALAIAEADGFIRTFVDEGAPMAQLLCEAAVRGMMPDYVAKLLAAFEGETQDRGRMTSGVPPASSLSPLPLVEPLSPREFEVLQLLAQGLSNREIGERLFLALDTVKGHNRRLYGKLGVKNRTQAVYKARAYQILPLF